MATINRKREKENRLDKAAHQNWMGGTSYTVNPLTTLQMAASSCFFGEPQYYHVDQDDKRPSRSKEVGIAESRLLDKELSYLRDTLNALDPQEWRGFTPTEMMEKAIDAALEYNLEATLQLAVNLRQEWFIRVTPQVILVRAAHNKAAKGTGLIRQYAAGIIGRLDEVNTGLAYHIAAYGKDVPIPNSLKRSWRDAVLKADEYTVAKYRQDGREVNLRDVVRLCNVPYQTMALTRLMWDTPTPIANEDTWEAMLSKDGATADVWRKSIPKMGHMAMLRNIRNFLQKGLKPDEFMPRLLKGVKGGKQLPFRYYSAYREIQKVSAPPAVLDGLETALMESLGNTVRFHGKAAILCDNSGSAHGAMTSKMGTMTVSTIGNLMGVLTGYMADEGYVGVFGDRLDMVGIRKTASIFDQLQAVENRGQGVGESTENGVWLFFDKAIKEKQHWDHIFIYSDQQAGHGGLYGNSPQYVTMGFAWGNRRGSHAYIDVAKLIKTYREQVNPNVLVYSVQIAGYTDTLVPEFYDRTYIIGGWGEGVLRFAAHQAFQYGMATLPDEPAPVQQQRPPTPAEPNAKPIKPTVGQTMSVNLQVTLGENVTPVQAQRALKKLTKDMVATVGQKVTKPKKASTSKPKKGQGI